MADIGELLRREGQALVFDQYGTVVDMQQGLTEAVTPFLVKKGWTGNPASFVTWWRRTHFEDSMIDSLLDRGHTPYRQIGHRAVSQVMDRCEIKHTQAEVEWLVSEIERLKPFPDVIAALGRLAMRYKLVILSNGDRDMLEAAKPHIGVGAGGRVFQTALEDLCHGRKAHQRQMARHRTCELYLRRQPRLRLHRRQGARLPLDLHRPPEPPLWPVAAPAGFDRARFQGAGRNVGAGVSSRVCAIGRRPEPGRRETLRTVPFLIERMGWGREVPSRAG